MGMSFDDIWRVADARVASGRVPGYVGAVRVRGHAEIHAAGRTAVEPDSPPMCTEHAWLVWAKEIEKVKD